MRYLALSLTLLGIACKGGPPAAAPVTQGALPVVEGFLSMPDSVRLRYRMVGGGSETVLVPGLLYHRDAFDSLASATRRVVLYDSRGRGASDSVPPEKTGLDRELLDFDGVRQQVGADSVAIVAWSGLAYAAYVYALRHPERVTRLVLLAPVGPRWVPYWDSMRVNGRARTDTAALARLERRVQAGEFAGDQAGLCRAQAEVSNPTGFFDPTKADLAPDVCGWPNEWPDRYGVYVGRLLESFGKYDLRPDLARFTAPRLVIHGEGDNIPLTGSREWVAGLPNARLLVIREAAHWPQVEQPAQTIGAIRRFLEGEWPGEEIAAAR